MGDTHGLPQLEITQRDVEKIWERNHEVLPGLQRCVHALYVEQAEDRPDAPAICAWDGEMTYWQLHQQSTRLAAHLSSLGVGAEEMVPLCFEKSIWTVVAILAVLKAGGAFVPLDPNHPKGRHEEIFKQIKPKVVLTSILAISDRLISRLSCNSRIRCEVEPRNAVYVMFTSGSTGVPKGVVLEHGAVATSCLAHGKAMGLGPDTRALQFAAYTFDICIAEIITTLIFGGCICIPSEEDRSNALSEAINKSNVNWAQLTPTVARLIDPRTVPSLETLILGGERVDDADWKRWRNDIMQVNVYGPTECSIWCTSHCNTSQEFHSGMIGRSMASVSWLVDPDDHNKLVPFGAIGELLIEGPILARGYLNDVSKTEAAFINNPAWLIEGSDGCAGRQGRLYKTGDLAYYDADGNLIFVGRKDSQVKVRGQRVELGEIEHHLHHCMSGVTQVAAEVILPSGDQGTAMVVAFVQLSEQARHTLISHTSDSDSKAQIIFPAHVNEQMAQVLPKDMVPEVYFAVEQFPLTTSAKVDRQRLRKIGASFSAQQLAHLRTQGSGPKRKPSTKKETILRDLWAQVLSLETGFIGMDDSFFSLGGDSIAAIKLVAEARRLGIQITVAVVFRNPTLDQLSSVAPTSADSSVTTIPRVNSDGPVAQSFAQGRMWFLEELHPGLTWYLMPVLARITGPLQLAALQSALQAIENRHEPLRTTFRTIGNESMQLIRPFHAKDVEIVDMDEQGLEDAILQDQTTPFDLRNEPGWRVSIYRISKEEHILSIVMHHIVSDGWSTDVLTRELGAFYSASIRGRNPLSQVQPLPVQYREFSAWQREQAQVDNYDRQLSYWRHQLKSSRPAELLCDKLRPASLSGEAGKQTLEISGLLYVNLQQFCKVHRAIQFMVLLAVFRVTHFRLTGQKDATIGTVNANRDRWELKDMIGFFVNLQCLRTTIEGEHESFEELVQQVSRVTIAALDNADVPFENIVSILKNTRDMSRHPLVQIIFAVHSQRNLGQLALEGMETESLDNAPKSRFDLEFHFFQHDGSLKGELVYSTDLYTSETINNMLSVFQIVLHECLREPKAAIASLPLLDKVNYSKLNYMDLLRVKKTDYPRNSSITDLFCQQASICRSCQTIVVFLGILKANLAYLPLDLKLPEKRIEAILSTLPTPGEKIVLLGADVQPPDVKLDNVRFIRTVDILDEQIDSIGASADMIKPSATSLAYVMFTSGSSGTPKGVMVEHRSIVRLVKDNNFVQHLPVSPIMAHMTNLAFDVSTWEIYASLLQGGTLVCIGRTTVLDPDSVLRIFRQERINTACMTPSLFRPYVQQAPAIFADLGMLCLSGEALLSKDLLSMRTLRTGKIINAYGPTEDTVFDTYCLLSKIEEYPNGPPIGRSISNSGAYIMDSRQRLVPLAVVGELVVTGDGLARGYTDPELNANRFITVEIGGETVKAYRTGDYARCRPTDGQLEHFGRMDGVKLRGHRIELGEVEHVLRSHKSVREAVVVVQQHNENEAARLAAFVSAFEGDEVVDRLPSGNDELQHVDTWENQFDSKVYMPISDVRPETIGRDFIGWTSMYDGSAIDKVEMNEWLDETIDTMLNGHPPGKILEIGTGTGMVLFNLGDGLESYVGLDPSRKAVEFVSDTARSMPALAEKVRIYKATAAEIDRLPLVDASLVVINSVAQYFPSLEYLFKTVRQLLDLQNVSTLFFGDVRSYALHRDFLAARALLITGEGVAKDDVRRIIADMERVERELLVDPAFFTALSDRLPDLVEHVEILPKRMKATNELSSYRYAAVIHVKPSHGRKQEQVIRQVGHDEWIDFAKRKLDRVSLLEHLQSHSSSSTIAVRNIPYSKTIVSRCLVDSLDDTESPDRPDWLSSVYQQAEKCPSMSATSLHGLAKEANYSVEISWSRQHSQRGGLDAIFHRYQTRNGEKRVLFRFPSDHAERPLHSLSSTPLRQQVLQRTQKQLQEILEAQLPAYMVPQTITFLEAMPTNQNGKVDRRALAQRTEEQTSEGHEFQRDLTRTEMRVQQLMSTTLHIDVDRIGLEDSFFQLGGDSIAAMKLVAIAREEGIRITVAKIFQYPKLIQLAAVAQEYVQAVDDKIVPFSLLNPELDATQTHHEVAASCGVDRSVVEDIYPCSPLQEGLMSLTVKRPGDYIMQTVLELRADVDEGAFRNAWEKTVQSLQILRTRIVIHNTLGLLQIVIADRMRWAEADDLPAYLAQDKLSSMQLGKPLARYALVRDPRGEKRWFVWTIHHAIYDGWALTHILNAIQAAYHGAAIDDQIGFNKFIKYLSQMDQDAAALYWRTALSDCEASTFPSLLSGVQQPVADATVEYQCPPLPKRTSNITISTLIRAAWAIVASGYTGSDDVVFGATVTGRNAPVIGIESLVGPVIATVPVRIRLHRESTVLELLETIQKQATDMIPFEQTGLQRIAKLGPDAQHACSFQTLLIVQPADDAFQTDDAFGTWEFGSGLQDFTTYALMIQCKLSKDGVKITASFDARLIEQWQIENMLAQLSFVMQQLARGKPDTSVVDIELLTQSDVQQLWKWNEGLPPTIERCVHDLFSEQVRSHPKKDAICAWDGAMTYEELDDQSSRLAQHLRGLGVTPESIVPICFEKSKWVIVGRLAVLKAGGAFAPLEPDHPTARHQEIFEQTEAKLVLTSVQYATLWPSCTPLVLAISKDLIDQLPTRIYDTPSAVQTGSIAYVIFTSGSTGVPKGVQLEHRAVSTSCICQGPALGITKNTRALQFSAYTFDACILEIVRTLVHGGCVCIPSESQRRNDLINTINTMKVTWALLTPTVARILDPQKIKSLKTLALGGEKVNALDCKIWSGRVQLVNAYGPTECCVSCVANPAMKGLDQEPIGRLAPLGAVGELLIEGPNLARGYLNDAKKTEAAFIHDPPWLLRGNDSIGGRRDSEGHSGRRGRLYKTGDLVYYTADGSLVYVGRQDGQVKVRGQRIELDEIEYHLYQCMPNIKEIAVEVISPTGGEPMVAAFLQAHPELLNDATSDGGSGVHVVFPTRVEDDLSHQLPKHMVPGVYFALSDFPISTSGKIDRKRLRRIGESFSAQQLAKLRTRGNNDPKRQPQTEQEKVLQQLWARVLNIDIASIGLDDSFFRLGGDSIAAMKLVREARNVDLIICVQDVFQAQRLGQLAKQLAQSSNASQSEIIIPKVDHKGLVTQSFAQGRLWFLEQLHPGLDWYHMHLAVRIRGPLQLHALQAALLAIEVRHEALRTTFSTKDGEGLQEVHPFSDEKKLRVIDIGSDDGEVLLKALEQEQRTQFDLQSMAGWRVCVFRINEENHVLSIVMHHIVSDGWSVDIVKRELSALYAAAIRDGDEDLISCLLPLPIQYRDFSVWQKLPHQVQEHQRQLEYWVNQLDGGRAAEFIYDKRRPATLSGRAGTQNLNISHQLYSKLQSFARERGVTLFVVLLAAFRAAHYRLTNQDDAIIGVPNANRSRWEVRDLIRFFVNIQCLRTRIQDETFGELVQQVYTTVVDSLANQDVPFESIVSALQGERDISRNPLAQVGFAVHSQQDIGKLAFEGLQTETIEGVATSRFDLECHFFHEKDNLQGYTYFSEELFSSGSIHSLASVFTSILSICLDKPETQIAVAPLMTTQAQDRLDTLGLLRMNQTAYSRDASIVDLNAQLEKLAKSLATRRFAPETAVGVLAHRCCQAIVAFLGILKAGLAYLPFDSKAPEKRLEVILSTMGGNKLVLVGPNIRMPGGGLKNVEFADIVDILDAGDDVDFTRTKLNPDLSPSASSLAYVLFTSGSTGQPKGVMVEHRGIVRLAQHDQIDHFKSSGTTAHMANLAFDVSSWEIYTCLLNGGTLICIDTATVLDQDALSPESPDIIGNLETLLVAGDRADPDDFFTARSLVKNKVVNAYGPTENSVMSTLYMLSEDEDCVNGVPIGRAISNSGAHVMDPEQKLVPLGVIGELVVTGDGVARGYTDSRRNVDRFVPVTIGTQTIGTQTMHGYRTRDYVRQRPEDGHMEFSVASMARSRSEATVLSWERLRVSFVDRNIGMQPETIGQDFLGWTSMYNGADIDKLEMKEWLDETINAIRAKAGGQLGNVLEIGSGSGMILFNLGDSLRHYTGFEPSTKAVEFIMGTASSIPSLANKVEMYEATAADVTQVDRPLRANLVILNSVIQYFPSQEYLFNVVRDLLQVDGIETLFFGDVRSHALHREFFATRALFMAGERAVKEDLLRIVDDMDLIERELLVDPGFFTSLTRRLPDLVQHVEIQPKSMEATNELSSYRYTAVVYSRSWIPPCGEVRAIPDNEWIDFQERSLNRRALQQMMENTSSKGPIAISNIPCSKTIVGSCLVDFLVDEKFRRPIHVDWTELINQEAKRIPSLSAVDLHKMAESSGYHMQISWNRQYSQRGGLDAVFYPRHINGDRYKDELMFLFPTDHEGRPQHTFTNKPMRQQLVKEVQQQLDELVKLQLPPYMVPQYIQVLDRLPMNQNGKVDRKALIQRIGAQTAVEQEVQQREPSSTELALQNILARVLGVDTSRVGLENSFFQLGGDSLAAMKIVAVAREYDIQLTVANIFQHPKIVDLATVAQFAQPVAEEKAPQPFSFLSPSQKDRLLQAIPATTSNVESKDILDILPTTWMQNLFVSRGVKDRALAFNYFFLDLGTRVDAHRLRQSIPALIQHFSILRTRFVYVDGRLWQAVLRRPDIPFTNFHLNTSLDEAADTVCLKDSRTTDALELPTAFMLVRCASNEHRLVIRISHAQYDGVCFPSFVRTLFAIYSGKPAEPSYSHSVYLSHIMGTKSASALYWRNLLEGSLITRATPLLGPKVRHNKIPVEVQTESITSMPQVPTGLTLASLIISAWAKVLSKITGKEDVVYGYMIAGRNANIPAITKIVGPCLNIIPVRARIHLTTTPTELVHSIQEQYIALGDADSMGFDEIVQGSTDWPADTAYDSVFQHQNLNEHPEFDFEDTNARLHWFQNPDSVPAILTVVSYPLEDGLKIVVRGNEHMITPENAEMINRMLCEMIRELSSSLQ
ncbi:nonribosomal peptide synthetase 3 [Paraphoma chrysanthemicola]|uniref:Nonribosomal peptide synthetase 3 n=1 Tax=Paraphoma chrysanthemicola TaxID=798071 RepID=A0A8K0R398_9PLEO|nr:nonribosomal peptide synthetase 3 [Paraphoma chrysanthemicola]